MNQAKTYTTEERRFRDAFRKTPINKPFNFTLHLMGRMKAEILNTFRFKAQLIRLNKKPRALAPGHFHVSDFYLGDDWINHEQINPLLITADGGACKRLNLSNRLKTFFVTPHFIQYFDFKALAVLGGVKECGMYRCVIVDTVNGIPKSLDKDAHPEIIASAIDLSGVVIPSVRHEDVLVKRLIKTSPDLLELHRKARKAASDYDAMEYRQGFVDIHQRFIGRRDAMTIVKLSGQPISPRKKSDFHILYSEDVWTVGNGFVQTTE